MPFTRVPLIDRIGTYIPRELNIKSLKNMEDTTLWDSFDNLVNQRNVFVHPDFHRLYSCHETDWDNSYFGLSLSGQCENCFETAMEVIKYHWEGDLPEWMKEESES